MDTGSYVACLLYRMQFKQKIKKQIISLSIVSIVFDTAEMRRMNRALIVLKKMCRKIVEQYTLNVWSRRKELVS